MAHESYRSRAETPNWECMPCAYAEDCSRCWHGQVDQKTGAVMRCRCARAGHRRKLQHCTTCRCTEPAGEPQL